MKKVPKYRLISEFKIFGFLIIFAVVALSCWFSWRIYTHQQEFIVQRMENQGEQITRSFEDTINHTSYVMTLAIEQIKENYTDLEYIHNIINKFRTDQKAENLLGWTIFSWANKEHFITVDAVYGIMEKPFDLSIRDYIHEAKKQPAQIQLGAPVFGSTSNRWMIPAGIGATDSKGNYIGAMTIGFDINTLIEHLRNAINVPGIEFALLDYDQNVVLQSSHNITEEEATHKTPLSPSFLEEYTDFVSSQDKDRSITHIFGGGKSYHLHKLSTFPYILYISYDSTVVGHELWQKFIFRIIEVVCVGGILLLILLSLYKRLLAPLVTLSHAADRLSQGKKIRAIPKTGSYEIRNLRLQLLKVKHFMRREKIMQKKLSEAVEVARESKMAKEEFLRRLRRRLRLNTVDILENTHVMVEEEKGPLPKEYKAIAERIFMSAEQLHTMTTNVLNRTLIDAKAVIEECVAVHKEPAYLQQVSLSYDIADEIEPIFVDEIRFRQIVIGTIYHALATTPDGENVNVSSYIQQDEHRTYLLIKVKDTGFGISQETRERIFEETETSGMNKDTDGTDLNISEIQKLVELHSGKFIMESTYQEGTEFTIIFPYIRQQDAGYSLPKDMSNVQPLFKKKT